MELFFLKCFLGLIYWMKNYYCCYFFLFNRPSASESGDDTATNDEYSRSFETSISSSYRASPVRQLPRPLVGARNGSLSFKSSRSSRCRLRGSESDTEDSFQSGKDFLNFFFVLICKKCRFYLELYEHLLCNITNNI